MCNVNKVFEKINGRIYFCYNEELLRPINAVKVYENELIYINDDVILHSIEWFDDYKKYCQFKNKKVSVFDFLRNNLKNDYFMSNNLISYSFEVVDDIIVINKIKKFNILGEFYFLGFKFMLTVNFQLFIENILDKNIQYIYYRN